MAWLVEQAVVTGKPGRNYWWVAPIMAQALIAYRRTKEGLPKEVFTANDTNSYIRLINGATIWFKGSDNPDSLFGEDVWACVIDEASRCRREAWHAIRTVLTFTKGPIRIIGNVRGRKNWAYEMARRAEAGEPDMTYHKITAADAIRAGIFDESELDAARRDLPHDVFMELYFAEAGDDTGNPFGLEYIAQCIAPLSSKKPKVWGWDLGQAVDYTVGIGGDSDGYVSQFHRFQNSWPDTEERMIQETQGLPALVDQTGVGAAVVQNLQRSGLYRFEGFTFTDPSRQELLFQLKTGIQKGDLHFPDGPIRIELESCEYVYTKSGVRYRVPESMHDDCMMALGLMWRHYGAKRISPESGRKRAVAAPANF